MLVRATAAQQLEMRRSEWARSGPVVALDIALNVAFLLIAVVVLAVAGDEKPEKPIRIWIVGYGIQYLVHVVLAWTGFRRRRSQGRLDLEEGMRELTDFRRRRSRGRPGLEEGMRDDSEDEDSEEEEPESLSFAEKCESVNTMVSLFYWVIGFYWNLYDGDQLKQSAPILYWFMTISLAFDMLFAILCVVLACFIGITLCCCLPCVIALLYAFPGQVQAAASDADLAKLPRYKYTESSETGEKSSDEGVMVPVLNNSGTSTSERILLREDAECCICLATYGDGTELCALPCNHHFHSTCIIKWLRIHAMCPLCKYDILKGSDTP